MSADPVVQLFWCLGLLALVCGLLGLGALISGEKL